MLTLETARILVVSSNEDDSSYLEYFFKHFPKMIKPDFKIAKFVSADQYDLIIFDARTLPPVYKTEDFAQLPHEVQQHYFLLDRYISDTTKLVVFFGKMYHKLNQERCISANSKFTLFARIRELIDFINHYQNEQPSST